MRWDALLTLASFVVIALVAWVLINSGRQFASFEAHCHEAGGHIYSITRAEYCLTVDGRMLEVYP